MILAEVARGDGSDVICTVLLIVTLIALVVGAVQALGFDILRTVDRFSPLVVGVVLLIIYLVLC